MVFGFGRKTQMPAREDALRGRDTRPYAVNPTHVVLGTPLEGPWPDGSEVLYVAMGCFWGVERIFWRQDGVIATAAGYMGGYTPNPTYEGLLKAFWENHDPTTANRQGNDIGTAYRSAIYWTTEGQRLAADATREAFQKVLDDAGHGQISTEIRSTDDAGPFYLAEDYHQGYLHKNPGGYCNHGPNGLTCPVGIVRQDQLPSQQEIAPPA